MADLLEWHGWIEEAIRHEVSDIYLSAGQPPCWRFLGKVARICEELPEQELMEAVLHEMLTDIQWQQLQKERDLDFSWPFWGRRFRGNACYQQGRLAIVLRLLPARIPSPKDIGMPEALQRLMLQEQGLILVTGRTGSGKTTTLASFIELINTQRPAHIITLEDPLEYLYEPSKCFITQREYGRDFYSFPHALRSALREMPDVILVGEIRDAETMQTALMAAAAGVLVLGTLHTRSAAEAAMRMEGMFPMSQQDSVRAQVAEVLTGVFAQRLLPSSRGGRVCMTEVLLADTAVRNLIRQGKYSQIESVMMSRQQQGMRTSSAALDMLYRQGLITQETCEKYRAGGVC